MPFGACNNGITQTIGKAVYLRMPANEMETSVDQSIILIFWLLTFSGFGELFWWFHGQNLEVQPGLPLRLGFMPVLFLQPCPTQIPLRNTVLYSPSFVTGAYHNNISYVPFQLGGDTRYAICYKGDWCTENSICRTICQWQIKIQPTSIIAILK